jgi:S-adenosylmethionine hydrolase
VRRLDCSTLEIAVNGGNANAAFSLGKGDDVFIGF